MQDPIASPAASFSSSGEKRTDDPNSLSKLTPTLSSSFSLPLSPESAFDKMQDAIAIPAIFSSGEKPTNDTTSVTKSGQSVYITVYKTKIADQSRSITVTWCKNLLLHGLSVSLAGPNDGEPHHRNTCKIELNPLCFWRKQGSKRFSGGVDGKQVEVFWDLKSARFNHETEPCSEEYYVAVICDEEVVLLVGDLKKDAYRKTGCRPALIDPVMVERREHVFGKKKFSTRIRFREKGRFYGISIECKNVGSSNNGGGDPEMDVKIDGGVVIQVKHLQLKFRGNEDIYVNKVRVEVYWDVHDWLFSSGLRHALFIFKPNLLSSTSSSSSSSTISSPPSFRMKPLPSLTGSSGSVGDDEFSRSGSSSSSSLELSEFCLFLYAWMDE